METKKRRVVGSPNGAPIHWESSFAERTQRLPTSHGGTPRSVAKHDRLALGIASSLRGREPASRDRTATQFVVPHGSPHRRGHEYPGLRLTACEPPADRAGKASDMKYLTVIECPVVFPGENEYALSSVDMLPRLGIAAGLESRHMRILDARVTAVCIWTSAFTAKQFFDEDWHAKADLLWGDDYQTRFEEIDGASAA